MTGKFTARSKPEEEELGLKRQELQALENQLVERELYLVSLKGEFAAFERLYLKAVGVLYAELDEIEAQIAEVRLRHNPSDREAHAAARGARAHADETRTTITDIALTESVRFSAPPSLKDLYREVARRIHPDLATDEADRARRQRFMAQANRAYEDGNEVRLREILEEYESSPEAVQGQGIGQDLVRVIRKTAQVKRRLREIEEEVQKVLDSELAQLKARADEATKKGRDLLEEMAESLRVQIRSARKRLEELG